MCKRLQKGKEKQVEKDSDSKSVLDKLVDREKLKEELDPDESILSDLKTIMSTPSGQNFLAYVLESTNYGRMPRLQFMTGQGEQERQKVYWESVGFFRFGQAMFDLMNNADTTLAMKVFEKVQLNRREENAGGRE